MQADIILLVHPQKTNTWAAVTAASSEVPPDTGYTSVTAFKAAVLQLTNPAPPKAGMPAKVPLPLVKAIEEVLDGRKLRLNSGNHRHEGKDLEMTRNPESFKKNPYWNQTMTYIHVGLSKEQSQ